MTKNATNKTLTQYFNEAKQAEESANKNLSIATLQTDRVLLALVLKASRQDKDIDGLPCKKYITEYLFKKYKMDKTDAGKSAIYNKASVVYYMMTNHANECLHIKETTSLSDADIMAKVNDATKEYKDHQGVLKTVQDARKKPERKNQPTFDAVKIDAEHFTGEQIFSCLKSKFLNASDADSAVDSIVALLDKVTDAESIAKIREAVNSRLKTINKMNRNGEKKAVDEAI